MAAATGVWIAYAAIDENGYWASDPAQYGKPVTLAVFTAAPPALWFALQESTNDHLVKVAQVPFGKPIAEALKEQAESPAAAPKAGATPGPKSKVKAPALADPVPADTQLAG